MRFWAGLRPERRHLRACMMKCITPERLDTVLMKWQSSSYESTSSTPAAQGSLCFSAQPQGAGTEGDGPMSQVHKSQQSLQRLRCMALHMASSYRTLYSMICLYHLHLQH